MKIKMLWETIHPSLHQDIFLTAYPVQSSGGWQGGRRPFQACTGQEAGYTLDELLRKKNFTNWSRRGPCWPFTFWCSLWFLLYMLSQGEVSLWSGPLHTLNIMRPIMKKKKSLNPNYLSGYFNYVSSVNYLWGSVVYKISQVPRGSVVVKIWVAKIKVFHHKLKSWTENVN